MGDLLRPGHLPAKLEEARRHYEHALPRSRPRARRSTGTPSPSISPASASACGPLIKDASLVLHRQMASGYSVLFEGAQATLLDVDHGSYPFVTSSSAVAGRRRAPASGCRPRASTASSASPRPTPRGWAAGPLPTEIGGALEEEIRARGQRVRRLHRPPAPLRLVRRGGGALLGPRQRLRLAGPHQARRARRPRRDQGLHRLPLRGRAAHRDARRHVRARGLRAGLRDACPAGRRRPRARATSPSCPRRRAATSSACPSWCGCEIGIVSTGPDRADTILRSQSAIASWFD